MIEDSYGGTETDQAFCRKVHLRDLIYLLSWLRKKRRKIIALVFLIRDFISFWRCADIWGKPHYDVPGAEYFLWLRVVGSFCGSLEELASHPPPNLPFSPVLAVFAIHFAVENRCLGSLLKIKKAIENRLGHMVWIFWYFPIVGKCYKFYATLSNAQTFHFLTT